MPYNTLASSSGSLSKKKGGEYARRQLIAERVSPVPK